VAGMIGGLISVGEGWVDGRRCAVVHGVPVPGGGHQSLCMAVSPAFPLSFREAEEMMMERGVVVSHETIRQWCRKFGQTYANGLRRRRPRPGDKWHLDEVFIKINGKTHYLCRLTKRSATYLDDERMTPP
jgi:transposase-like protein